MSETENANRVDLSKPIYFYDDRSKDDGFYKIKEILFSDSDSCLCVAEYAVTGFENEKFYFNTKTGEVYITEFNSWIATNDGQWLEEKLKEKLDSLV